MITSVIILAVIGFCISVYAYIVEQKIKKNADYKPACDLSDRISCSKVIQSPYASLFSLSNAQAGVIYYILVAILALFRLKTVLIVVTLGGVLVSAILAFAKREWKQSPAHLELLDFENRFRDVRLNPFH